MHIGIRALTVASVILLAACGGNHGEGNDGQTQNDSIVGFTQRLAATAPEDAEPTDVEGVVTATPEDAEPEAVS